MSKIIKAVCVPLCLVCILFSSVMGKTLTVTAETDEIRAVWAATVYNLDYPSRATTNSSILKADIDTMIDDAYSLGYNTLFFQVRPSADAFYASDIFPGRGI